MARIRALQKGTLEMIDRRWLLGLALAGFVAGIGAPARAGDGKGPGKEPKLVHKVAPQYPPEAKDDGTEGTVVLEATIAKDGSVSQTRVKQDADPRLVKAARAAVGQWRYEPVRDADGKPVEATISVTVRFALEKKK
jgi:protein TonB